MIRKVVIVVLTLGAVGTGVMWVSSYHLELRLPRDSPPWGNYVEVWCYKGTFWVTVHTEWGHKASDRHSKWGPVYYYEFASFGTMHPDWTTHFGLSAWCPQLLLALYPIIAFTRGPLRRCSRRKRGFCLTCGYNLTGNVSGVCPECGTPT